MPKQDPRVDAYIARAADFARPILLRVRKLVHAACPDVTEAIKWGVPFYEHKGILLATPAFKQHCALIFWKGKLIFDKGDQREKTSPSHFTRRFARRQNSGRLHQASRRTERSRGQNAAPPTEVQRETHRAGLFSGRAAKNKKALVTFQNFSPSCQREYVEWITDAKREETRAKRMQTAIEWIAKGKSRNWKYQ